MRPHHQKALILGNGGATAAVVFVFKKLGIGFTIVSRTPGDASLLNYKKVKAATIKEHSIIVNTTPVGMYPGENDCPAIPYQYISGEHLLYDLIYNPAKTLFLQKGEERGATIKNGEEMLMLQAEESWRIWNQ